jgi:hypothetical protein
MVHSVNVDVEGAVPGAGVYFEQAASRRAAGTMHEHIQPPKRTNGRLHAADCFGGIRNVSRDGQSSAIQRLHISFHALSEQVVSREAAHRDVRPAKSELAGRSCAYAAAPSRNQANLSF